MDDVKMIATGNTSDNQLINTPKDKPSVRISPRPVIIYSIAYLVLIVAAELLAAFFGVLIGAILNAILLVVLVNYSYFSKSAIIQQISLPLMLVPLLRILSFTVAIPDVYPIFWYVLVGIPLLLAALLLIIVQGLPAFTQRLNISGWVIQGLFGLLGIPLGILASYILPPLSPIIPDASIAWVAFGAFVLFLFSALTDEIIFRGFIQKTMTYVFGSGGLVIGSLFYACMFIGTLQISYILFFGLTGFLFSLWVKLTNSLWGAVFAHTVLNVIFILVLVH